MITLILIIGIILLLVTMYRLKIQIDFKSFFKKGFVKLDNLFGIVLYCR